MSLLERIKRASTSIDRAFSKDQVRFNPREQAEILAEVQDASAEDRTAARTLLQVDAFAPNGHYEKLWQPADEPFRLQLEAALGDGVRTAAASSKANVVSRSQASDRQHKSAILLIDADYDFATHPKEQDRERGRVAEVLKRANRLGLPVFEIVWLPYHETHEDLARHRRRDNWVRVEKTSESAFDTSGLEDELRARGITKLVVMGLFEEACVLMTSLDARRLGLEVETAPELVTNRGERRNTDRSKIRFPENELIDDYTKAGVRVVARLEHLSIFEPEPILQTPTENPGKPDGK